MVVLAAGDGTRLASLTTNAAGVAVPKQFCSLDGGDSLVGEAVGRAARLVPHERICAIVAERHRPYWRDGRLGIATDNIFVQPLNRGTAHGILLSVLSVLERDPLAHIVFLPADHHVRDEVVLARALRHAALLAAGPNAGLVLLGIEPEEADPELGYIVPGRMLPDGSRSVAQFVEKPPVAQARELLERGALWNSFIFAGGASALLGMFRARMPGAVDAMATAIAQDDYSRSGSSALGALYDTLPGVDFSRQILQGAESHLRVVAAPACGWTDLGTPRRVAETLSRLGRPRIERPTRVPPLAARTAHATINLALQHSRAAMPTHRYSA